MATLQQRCGNVLITSESEFVTTLETDVRTTLIFDRATTLWQHQQRHCDNVVTASQYQLEYSQYHHQVLYFLYLTCSQQHNNVTTTFVRPLNWCYCTKISNSALLKPYFCMDVLLQIRCVFAEHLFRKTPSGNCFCLLA